MLGLIHTSADEPKPAVWIVLLVGGKESEDAVAVCREIMVAGIGGSIQRFSSELPGKCGVSSVRNDPCCFGGCITVCSEATSPESIGCLLSEITHACRVPEQRAEVVAGGSGMDELTVGVRRIQGTSDELRIDRAHSG